MTFIRAAALAALALAIAAGAPAGAQPGGGEAEIPDLSGAVPDELLPGGGAEAEEPAPAEPEPQSAYESAIERVWFAPASTLEDRVDATRRASLEYGVWSLDPAARAILSDRFGGDPLERARAAVRLAPDLPAARIELARAVWLQDESPISALRIAGATLLSIPRHLEASLWFAGSALYVLAVAMLGGGALCIALFALYAVPHAAHDLGDLVSTATPGFARAALLAIVLLAPLVLGEGVLGVVVVGLALAVAYSSRWQAFALVLAAAAIVAGAFPAARWAGTLLAGFASDPVAEAAYSTAGGESLVVDRARLEAAADSDPLAARALALRARRTGSLSVADAHYQALREAEPGDWRIANNAANVRLHLGHMETALDLYQEAADRSDSPVVLYNLSQAYGRSFQVEELAETLERAQDLDGDLVAELTNLQGSDTEGFVVDLPVPRAPMWERLRTSMAGQPVAAELRAPLAPGVLGRDVRWVAAGLAAAVLLGSLVDRMRQPSRWCPRCGRRVCPRCHPQGRSSGELCVACTRLFYQPEETDRALRVERLNVLRKRERRLNKVAWALSLAVPGAAGLLARRPLRALIASLCFCLAVAAASWRNGVVPDPLVAGVAAPVFFLGVTSVAGIVYAALVGTCLAARKAL